MPDSQSDHSIVAAQQKEGLGHVLPSCRLGKARFINHSMWTLSDRFVPNAGFPTSKVTYRRPNDVTVA